MLGMASFIVNVMAGAWIKYAPYRSVSICSTAIMAVTLVYLVYAHTRWAPYLLSSSDRATHSKALAVRTFHKETLLTLSF